MAANPALTIALALVAGMVAQAVARHIRLPGIVLLLIIGVLLGPDVFGIIYPASLGSAMPLLVGFAVAVILFEGGMNLRPQRIKREGLVIRQLITIGTLVTTIGGTLMAKLLLPWDWRQSILFGTIIIVTGPTVVTPLLRRIKLKRSVSTILEAEGILLDAIGAIIAVVALEIALHPSGFNVILGAGQIVIRLVSGIFIGGAGGWLLARILRFRNLVPEGLENVFTLSLVLALFQISNVLSPESGIVAVTVAGMVVGNSKTIVQRELMDFKEQLTVLFVGMLFILLAADVHLSDVKALGWRGLLTVIAIMVVVRPLNVMLSTRGSKLNFKQKVLLSWIAPRGIVAAAVASLFAIELNQQGLDGESLRAMVFLVITITVLFAGLTGGLVARGLDLRRQQDAGWVVLGAHELARLVARLLQERGEEVVCIDANPVACQLAEKEGLRVIYGNGLETHVLLRAEIDTRKGVLALTPNEEVNLLFAKNAKTEGRVKHLFVGIKSGEEGTTTAMVHDIGGNIPFGHPFDPELWMVRLRRKEAQVEWWTYHGDRQSVTELLDANAEHVLLPLICQRGEQILPVSDKLTIRKKDHFAWLINSRREDTARAWLKEHEWVAVDQ
jgi:NhaP-type Na+/H+ or K+/H+ antiporter